MSFDFDAAVATPHRMQPGLRRLAAGARQLSPTVAPQRGLARHLREKLAVLGAFADQALLCMPGFDPTPALVALAALAQAEHADAFCVQGPRWHARWLGWALDADDVPEDTGTGWPEIGALLQQLPRHWRRAALLSLAFAEDFAILDGTSATLPWLAVALPSMWAPEQKIGRHFTAVHAPVADNRLVVGAADQLVKLVTTADPGKPGWERFVWTLSPHPRLHAHPARVDPARWPSGLDDAQTAAHAWWRTERQTFIPVPGLPAGQAQAVFTIRVDVTPLGQALDAPESGAGGADQAARAGTAGAAAPLRAARAARLHDALASMSAAVLVYRGLDRVQPALLRWLARQAHGAPG